MLLLLLALLSHRCLSLLFQPDAPAPSLPPPAPLPPPLPLHQHPCSRDGCSAVHSPHFRPLLILDCVPQHLVPAAPRQRQARPHLPLPPLPRLATCRPPRPAAEAPPRNRRPRPRQPGSSPGAPGRRGRPPPPPQFRFGPPPRPPTAGPPGAPRGRRPGQIARLPIAGQSLKESLPLSRIPSAGKWGSVGARAARPGGWSGRTSGRKAA